MPDAQPRLLGVLETVLYYEPEQEAEVESFYRDVLSRRRPGAAASARSTSAIRPGTSWRSRRPTSGRRSRDCGTAHVPPFEGTGRSTIKTTDRRHRSRSRVPRQEVKGLPAAVVLMSLCVAIAAGCGGAPEATPEQAQSVAQRFVTELIERHDVEAALAYAPGLRTDIELAIDDAVSDKLRLVGGVREGCVREDFFDLPTDGPCYRVRLRGDPVPDPGHPGLCTIAFGWLSIALTPTGDPPTVRAIVFQGGGRYSKCKST